MLLQRIAQKKAIEKLQTTSKTAIDGIVEKSHSPMLTKNVSEPHPYGNIMLGNSYNNKMLTPINFVDNISIQGVE